jgi:GNAT superfamily N-acetyltransferase
MNLSIRPASTDDAEAIHRFICELANYEREPDAVKNTPENLRRQLADTHAPFECFIAEIGDTPVGFALYFFTYSTWEGVQSLYLEDLYVSPVARKAGVGTALMKRLARTARERGCARMEWSVLDWNQLAIGLYEALGARAQNEWVGYRVEGSALETLAED